MAPESPQTQMNETPAAPAIPSSNQAAVPPAMTAIPPVAPAPMMQQTMPISAPSSQTTDYATKLGGVLAYMRYSALFSGVVMIIAIPAIIFGSLIWGVIAMATAVGGYGLASIAALAKGILLIAMLAVAIAIAFRTATQIKNRDHKVYETMMTMFIIYIAYGVIDAVLDLLTQSAGGILSGIPSFVLNLVWGVVFYILQIGFWTAYWSKSKRVFAWFGTRPVQNSRYWGLVSKLPPFVWNEEIPDFISKMLAPAPIVQQSPVTRPTPYANPQPPVYPSAPQTQPAPVVYAQPPVTVAQPQQPITQVAPEGNQPTQPPTIT